MAFSATIILTTAGIDTGPFDLYSDVDGYVSAFETGVAKVDLQAGYTSTLVPNGSTIIRVKSTGTCTNYTDLPIGGVTTTTTTTTQDLVQVVLYARHDPGATTFPTLKFAYSTDGGSSWTAVGASFTDTSCSQRGIITIQRNSSLFIKVTEDGNVTNVWQSARDASGCPAFSSAACSWPALTNLNTRTYYFTVNGDNQGVC